MNDTPPPVRRVRQRDPAKEQSWRSLLEHFTASGQTVREFCLTREIKRAAFYFWRRQIQRRDQRVDAQPKLTVPRPVAFSRVLIKPPEANVTESSLRLCLHGGRELLLPARMPADQIAAIVHAIESRPSITEGAA